MYICTEIQILSAAGVFVLVREIHHCVPQALFQQNIPFSEKRKCSLLLAHTNFFSFIRVPSCQPKICPRNYPEPDFINVHFMFLAIYFPFHIHLTLPLFVFSCAAARRLKGRDWSSSEPCRRLNLCGGANGDGSDCGSFLSCSGGTCSDGDTTRIWATLGTGAPSWLRCSATVSLSSSPISRS